MLTIPQIDPIALQLGPLKIRWYGLMYLLAFASFWWLGTRRAHRADAPIQPDQISDLLFYGAIGVILGGRIGYVLFYGLDGLLEDPLSLFRVWEGGMSYHGGMLGVAVAIAWYARKMLGTGFFRLADFVAPLVPLGLFFGRIGNFINGELWGRPTDLPWGMVFPHVDGLARHPSSLYQATLEGLALFAILWIYSARPRPTAAVTGLFLIGYGVFRFLVEFVRQPDSQLGFIALDWMSMGQALSLPMIIIGTIMMVWAYRKNGVPA
jgi:phosphatidylglycerol:prolipoprotein diacylglycerol transferase